MLRERLDEYLDGVLDATGRREVEAALVSDPKAAARLSHMKAQRALRAAAMDSYLPAPEESKAMAESFLAGVSDAPIGYVGKWVRRVAAVAAGLLILAGTFEVGRMTAPPVTKTVETTRVVYSVVYNELGEQQVVDFDTIEDRNDFVKYLDQRGVTGLAYVETLKAGEL